MTGGWVGIDFCECYRVSHLTPQSSLFASFERARSYIFQRFVLSSKRSFLFLKGFSSCFSAFLKDYYKINAFLLRCHFLLTVIPNSYKLQKIHESFLLLFISRKIQEGNEGKGEGEEDEDVTSVLQPSDISKSI